MAKYFQNLKMYCTNVAVVPKFIRLLKTCQTVQGIVKMCSAVTEEVIPQHHPVDTVNTCRDRKKNELQLQTFIVLYGPFYFAIWNMKSF